MTRRLIHAPAALLAVLLFVPLALPHAARGQSSVANHARVGETLHLLGVWADARVAYEGIPGGSLAVVHDQELVWAAGYGFTRALPGGPHP